MAGLDLTLRNGELMVLLGPTGAGKTTTLRLVAGLERPDGGRVWIGGRDVSAVEPAGRDVAFVFQAFSLYPHDSVLQPGLPLALTAAPAVRAEGGGPGA